MAKGRSLKGGGLLASVMLVAVACTSAASPSPSPAPSAAPSAAASASAAASPSGQNFSGVSVTVLTFTGPQIAEPLQRRAPDFAKLTGADIKVVTVPFNELYQKILTDIATGTNAYQAFVFDPQWMGDFVTPGYLEDLTDRVKSDPVLKWDDIGAFFRDFSATYQGKVYTIPLDGDVHMV